MANYSCAKKAIRQNKKRNRINSDRISRMRTCIKKLKNSIVSPDVSKDSLMNAFKLVQSEIMKAKKFGVIKHNNASRKVSKLINAINAKTSR